MHSVRSLSTPARDERIAVSGVDALMPLGNSAGSVELFNLLKPVGALHGLMLDTILAQSPIAIDKHGALTGCFCIPLLTSRHWLRAGRR